jgi:glycosyltransferase involved in cell wall biosynthesis
MRILFTVHTYMDVNAGASGATERLADELRQIGHDVEILYFDDLPVSRFGNLAPSLFALLLTARLLGGRYRQVDVIDSSSGDGWLLFALLAGRRRRPLRVTRSHGLEHTRVHADGSPRFRAKLYSLGWRLKEVEWSARFADLVLLLNTRDRDFAERNFGSNPTFRLTRNGVAAQLVGLPQPTPYAPEAQLHIVQLGSYLPGKGVSYSLPALIGFLERHPAARVSLLGTGSGVPPSEILNNFPEAVRRRVTVMPTYENEILPSLLQDAEVLVFASLSEGAPLAVPEAMACGLAPISTDIPGPTEIIRDGQNGLLVAPRSSSALLDALERLNGDRALLARLRKQAHQDAQRYNWASIAEEQSKLYEDAIKRPRQRFTRRTSN